ncbi:MAG: glycosyltransferase family 4 protein [Promethearchaeota archaeon]
MKITIVTPVFPYPKRGIYFGIERYVENLAINLKNIGNKVKIVTTFWNGGKRYDNYKGIPILRIFDSKTILGKIGSIFQFSYISFGFNLMRKKNFQFYRNSDVIILNLAIGFSKFFKLKNFSTISVFHHYDPPETLSYFFTLKFLHYLEKRQFKKLNHVITVSNTSKHHIMTKYHIKESSIKVISHGVDRNRYNPSNYSEEIRRKFGSNILLYSGLMIKRKKISVLLYAMKEVIKEIPDVHLILTGDGPLLNDFRNLAKSLEIQNNVSFLGFIAEKDLQKYYATSDIYVFPSELEGFGQTIIEAMASGTPVICANKPPMSENIGEGGKVFKINDSKDLSKKIIKLLSNRNELTNLKIKALEEIKRFDWLTVAHTYCDYIKQIKLNY